MSTIASQNKVVREVKKYRKVDYRLEAVVLPVSDVDSSKRFYIGLGWKCDADFVIGDEFRALQFTPPGSPCSIQFGKGITAAEPGTAQGLFLVVSDIEVARADLIIRGANVSEVFHRAGPGQPSLNGIDPERRSYCSYATFSDPDSNRWLLQEVTARLPGRVETDVAMFSSPYEFASALSRASVAHGEHEKRAGQHDADWPDWYAEYMVREQLGKPLPA